MEISREMEQGNRADQWQQSSSAPKRLPIRHDPKYHDPISGKFMDNYP